MITITPHTQALLEKFTGNPEMKEQFDKFNAVDNGGQGLKDICKKYHAKELSCLETIQMALETAPGKIYAIWLMTEVIKDPEGFGLTTASEVEQAALHTSEIVLGSHHPLVALVKRIEGRKKIQNN